MIPATVIALLALPLVSLRRRTLVAYYGTDAATWLLAWILWRRLPDVDPYLGFVTLAVVKLVTLFVFVANGSDVRWSSQRAAIMAAVIYALTIPAMLRTVIDGDEPFYLLVTESVTNDLDLDLRNQYSAIGESEAGRTDLVPQLGDPTGPNGEQYSRHEPFLALLMVPGYALGGLYGSIATIALFGVLLVRSTIRWMEDEGVPDRVIRAIFPFFAFAPPVLFYATRIWPEVPAAFFFVETLRGLRDQRPRRWIPALLGLVLLKLRFLLVAAGVLVIALVEWRRTGLRNRSQWNALFAALAIFAVPLLIVWMVSGSMTNVHTWRELLPAPLPRYTAGLFGLLSDGMSGIAFKAPFYLLGLFALTRWNVTPRSFKTGVAASAIYLLYLFPRAEWFGGWAPPLRYLVFLMPVLALGAAAVWDRIPRGVIAIIAAWSAGLVIHGVTYPWRLFHIANGENAVGEWWSGLYHADFSRLFPSFIRANEAAGVAIVVVVAASVLAVGTALIRRTAAPTRSGGDSASMPIVIALFTLALAAGFTFARQPGEWIEFEDAHVTHHGGELHPEVFTIMRVAHRGGWIVREGDSLSFLASAGPWRLEAITGLGATFEIGGRTYEVRPSEVYRTISITIPNDGRTTLRCLSGALNLDRMKHE